LKKSTITVLIYIITDVCNSGSLVSQASEPENLQNTARDIFDDTLMFEIPASNPNVPMLRSLYESLAESFDNRTSATGFSNFMEAVNEIALAEAIACSSSESLNVSELASDFASALSLNTTDESLREIRIILGQILCAESMEQGLPSGMACPSRGDCICPSDGIGGTISCTCQFFACLETELDRLGPVFGFSTFSTPVTSQGSCIAFIVDTTGSKADEIAAIRTVIENFLRSEEASNELRCYILVPFNDRGGNVDISKCV
jgi:hypothetical protein